MVGVTPDDGSRRRLPQWMLGMSSTGQLRKSGKVKENGKQLEEGLASLACHFGAETVKETLREKSHVLAKCETKRRKRKSTEQDADCEGNDLGTVPEKKCNGRMRRKAKDPEKGIQLHEKETLGENSYTLEKCETKRRKRRSNEQDAECDANVPGTLPEKKGNGHGRRKVQESAAPKRQKEKDSSCGSGKELELRTSSDDDVELTVEDLVIIAEEYIKADRNMKHEDASNRECESDSRLAERVSSSNVLGDSIDTQNCNQRSLIQDSTTSKPNGSLTSKEVSFSSSRTGDPAQDMLDLFLGPLLKRPVEKETKTELVTEDLAFSHEIKSQSHGNVVREEVAPIMKKKSSLKDKVAMFLD